MVCPALCLPRECLLAVWVDRDRPASMARESPGTALLRMAQTSVPTTLTYQHATSVRDRQIADALNARVEQYRKDRGSDDDEPDDGEAGALAPVG